VGYEDTWLWRRAFVEARSDAKEAEQRYFAELYLSMRKKAFQLVSRISADMPTMTVHDATHLDALWEMASIVTDEAVELNPPEAFVFGGAVLLHDAGMSLAAYPNGLDDLRVTLFWKDSYARLLLQAKDRGDDPIDTDQLEKIATADALRSLHAAQARNLPALSWRASPTSEPQFLIDDSEIRHFYGPKIGQIAESHWWPIAKVEEELANDLGPLGGKTGNRIDLVKIAALLRTADAMHLDRRRAPAFLRALLHPSGVSEQHWTFQERMAVPFVEKDTLVYSAAPSFEIDAAEAWWLAFDALSNVDRELRGVDHLLQKRNAGRLKANRVKGVDSPTDLARIVETAGWVPVDSTVRVSDVPKIVSTLGGRQLYGDKPIAALRELIQNAADAVEVRRDRQNRSTDWGGISVTLEERSDGFWLSVEDTGIGMSPAVLTGPLIDFGNSFWRSPLAASEFPGVQASGVRYGIGFFSIFMLGPKVLVTSRRYDKASDSVRTLEFQNGLGSRPILYIADEKDAPVEGGTRVSVRLAVSPFVEGGLLVVDSWTDEASTLDRVVASVAPNLDVRISVSDSDGHRSVVNPKDWLSLDEDKLCARIAGDEPSKPAKNSRLRQLVDLEGNVYGRAAVEDSLYGNSNMGCISIGGLWATKCGFVRGLFTGREHTAARDQAYPLAPKAVMSAWATEQGKILQKAKLPAPNKARAANVVLLCGGEIGSLPIARWDGEWIAQNELRALVKKSKAITVHLGQLAYKEDEDDVHPRAFSHHLLENQKILFVDNDFPGMARGALIENFASRYASPELGDLQDLVDTIIKETWAEDVTVEEDNMSVGTVEGTDINRDVLIFRKSVEF
jgi:hypothetical protein